MVLWEGEVKDGSIDWKNPSKLKRYLSEVDLDLLNFIPEGFDNEVSKLLPFEGKNTLTDKLVEDQYYALGRTDNLANEESDSADIFSYSCGFQILYRKDVGNPRDQPLPYLKGKVKIAGRVVDQYNVPVGGMKIDFLMDHHLRNENAVYTDSNGYFSYNKLYSGDLAMYGTLASASDSKDLWKICFEKEIEIPKRDKRIDLIEPIVAYREVVDGGFAFEVTPLSGGCYIDPLTIKTMKSNRFQGTFVATQEFETRLQAMHQLPDGELILNMYLNNIDQELWKCDNKAAGMLSGQAAETFRKFAEERLTTVESKSIHKEKLMAYFNEKRQEYRSELSKERQELDMASRKELKELRHGPVSYTHLTLPTTSRV